MTTDASPASITLPIGHAYVRALGWTVLAINALDITTSLIPASIDAGRPMPTRSSLGWAVQIALLVPFVVLAAQRIPRAIRWFAALPIPRTAKMVFALVCAIEVVHVALRVESFPFTPVAMFSTSVAPSNDPVWHERMYFVPRRDDRPEVLSFLREGTPFFARYFDIDYKSGWMLRLHAAGSRRSFDYVTRVLAERGMPRPFIADVGWSKRDGTMVTLRRVYP